MSKRHTVTLNHVFTVCSDMYDHIDGILRPSAKKRTQWKEDLYFAAKFAWQKLSVDGFGHVKMRLCGRLA